ncbi:MAG: helix-turn-helix transcriptional regulator [Actinobacillus minor]|nr:helix-turn-helix transcriptional regulator [Actinobacillus minor]
MLLHERLSNLMDAQGVSIEDLKNAANVSYEMARRYKLGIAEPRKEKLEKIAEFLGVTPSWLQFGEGQVSIHPLDKEDEGDEIVFNMLNIEASAGFGSNGDIIQVIRQIKYNPDQYYELYRGMNPDNVEIISVKGDSMAPTFHHSDLLFVDVTIQEFDGDGIYVFTYDGYIFVKRIQKTGNTFTVLSDNERYKEWEIQGDCYIHGKVKVHQSQKLNFIG